jgi:hypothetical protein
LGQKLGRTRVAVKPVSVTGGQYDRPADRDAS